MISSARSLVFLMWATASAALAQTSFPPHRLVDTYRIEHGQNANFASAMQDYNQQLKKAGWDRQRSVYRSLVGPRTYVVVRYYDTHADMPMGTLNAKLKDVAAGIATATQRMNEASSAERRIDAMMPDLSSSPTADVPRYFQTSTAHVKPEKFDEYMALVKSDIIPALKKAGVKAYAVARCKFGCSSYAVHMATGWDSLTTLDDPKRPVARGMDEASYQRFISKMRPLITDIEYGLYEYVPELSYTPGK